MYLLIYFPWGLGRYQNEPIEENNTMTYQQTNFYFNAHDHKHQTVPKIFALFRPQL